ncbi:hypothetical protein MRX96_035375 [Rhipicephalus microplus]
MNRQIQCKPEHRGEPRVLRRVFAATETACLCGHSAHLTQLLVLDFVHLAQQLPLGSCPHRLWDRPSMSYLHQPRMVCKCSAALTE